MFFQVSNKDFQYAVKTMKSNHAQVLCCKNPSIHADIIFAIDDNCEVYNESHYTVDRSSINLGRNVPLNTLINKFNEAIRNYVEQQDDLITINTMMG